MTLPETICNLINAHIRNEYSDATLERELEQLIKQTGWICLDTGEQVLTVECAI
jgi:hypothetical protein